MDKVTQVLAILKALRSVTTQTTFTDTYKGMEAQCVSTYRKCVELLKTVEGYEEIEVIAPELTDSATMREIGFAVEMLLSLVQAGVGHHKGYGFSMHIPRPPRPPRPPRVRMHKICGPGTTIVHTYSECSTGHKGKHKLHSELHDELQEKLDQEQEKFDDEVSALEDKIDELQDKIEEARDRLEERLEAIREKYEAMLEELDEDEGDDDDDHEDDDHDDDDPERR